MGIQTLYRKANTSRQPRGDEVHSVLRREHAVERSNPVRAADIADIPLRRGFSICFDAVRDILRDG